MFTTGDKLLNVMKEKEISIMELSRMSGVPESNRKQAARYGVFCSYFFRC